jgi:N-acetylglucosaminyldiphosphoundecaprenol N-acetyl-beta-D-mannosaminyltransferase
MIKKIQINELNFTVGSYQSVINHILKRINQKKSQLVLPCSLNDLASAQKNLNIKKKYNLIEVATLDGQPLVWWTKYIKKIQAERVYGPDLMKSIIRKTSNQKLKQTFFGSNLQTLQKLTLSQSLSEQKKRIQLISPPTSKTWSDKKYLLQIKKFNPNIIWIGLSSPQQVLLATKWKQHFPRTSIFCVGAAIDFIAQTKKQAPEWMQKNSLEWFFRLFQEPIRLWERYLVTIPQFLLHSIYKKISKK